nr:immunoglobulin light chain junction region [Macaca mulatta]
CQHHYSYPYSF